ncbi:UNVERIFIED_CONTAM: hypothetical protein Slati_4120400 [Sesamum latifolium]|uniref:Uncharacterized protein n=1 Tax=Sesamum latifolium TaxID=2727402 RepID=A0AAW2T981_9LAMI
MSAICSQVKDPEDYVHKYYWVDTYLKVYENVIYPLMVLHCGKRLDFFLHFHPMKEEHQVGLLEQEGLNQMSK